jgi:hypothetical protein
MRGWYEESLGNGRYIHYRKLIEPKGIWEQKSKKEEKPKG